MTGGQFKQLALIGGVAFFVAAALAVFWDGTGGERGSYETGEVIGAALRDLVLGLFIALAGNFFVKRAHGERPSWRRTEWSSISPGAVAAGGVVALGLAMIFGAPDSQADRLVSSAQHCRSREPNPVDTLSPRIARTELSDQEIRSLSASPDSSLEAFFKTSSAYSVSAGNSRSIVAVFPSDIELAHRGTLGGFSDSIAVQGFSPRQVRYAGVSAIEFSAPRDPRTAFYGRKGCYSVMIMSPSERSAGALATALLVGD